MDKKQIDELEASAIIAYSKYPDVFDGVEHLVSENLFNGLNRSLFNLIRTNHSKGLVSDVVLINAQLIEMGYEKSVIYEAVTKLLKDSAPQNVPRHIAQLFEEYMRNKLIPVLSKSADELQQGADVFEEMDNIKTIISDIDYQLHNVSKEKNIEQIFSETKQKIVDDCKKPEQVMGYSTGIAALDNITGGLKNEVIVIGATPGSGKTALLVNMIYANVIAAANPVLFFSMEMTAEQITKRIFSHALDINGNNINRGNLLDDDINKILAFKTPSTLIIDETSGITHQYIETKIRKVRKTVPIDKLLVVMVDYVQRMVSSGEEMKMKNHEAMLATRFNKLADIQKKYNCCMIELSQLSREVSKKQTPRPVMSDLKETSSIEANAHQIWMLFRPDMHEKDPVNDKGQSLKGLCEIGIVKNREGERGYIFSRFMGQYSKFLPYVEDAKVSDDGYAKPLF